MLAVVFGAGAVGVGFMGDLLQQSGARTIFYEVNSAVAQSLARQGRYTISKADLERVTPLEVGGVTALDGTDPQSRPRLAEALAGADLALTSVGARALPLIGALLAEVSADRPRPSRPLHVLCCENHRDAAGLLAESLTAGLGPEEASARFACVNTVVARMCQLLPPAERNLPPLTPDLEQAVLVEAYEPFPVDAGALRGPAPALAHLEAVPGDRFPAYEHRKLYAHNGVHALLAVLGQRRGYEFFHQAGTDPELDRLGRQALWEEVGAALVRAHPQVFSEADFDAFARDLYARLVNPVFGDSVERGVRGSLRMIRPEDGRLSTAALFVAQQGRAPQALCRGVAAVLLDNGLDLAGLEPALVGAAPAAAEQVRELTAAGLRALEG